MPFRFRQWVRSLFSPISFGNDENGLYEAFCLRKKEHGKGRGWAARLRRSDNKAVYWGLIVLYGLLNVVLFSRYPRAIYPSGLVLLFLLLLWKGRSRPVGHFMPATLSFLLLNARSLPHAMADVWMTGAGARETAWVVYRESRGKGWINAGIASAVVIGCGFLVYFGLCTISFLPAMTLSLSGLVLTVSVLVVLSPGIGIGGMKAVARKWKGDFQGRAAQEAKNFVLVLMALGIGVPTSILFAVYARPLYALWQRASTASRSFPVEYSVSALMGILTLVLWLAKGRAGKWNESRYDIVSHDFDDLYNRYMRHFIFHDSDTR